jgi:hypothetical protein
MGYKANICSSNIVVATAATAFVRRNSNWQSPRAHWTLMSTVPPPPPPRSVGHYIDPEWLVASNGCSARGPIGSTSVFLCVRVCMCVHTVSRCSVIRRVRSTDGPHPVTRRLPTNVIDVYVNSLASSHPWSHNGRSPAWIWISGRRHGCRRISRSRTCTDDGL